ncbi:hypothetical protein M569_00882 [Genlisea aurea]|uniref:acid phosphatase n=1 Tax=Genlisea aurea TaxID=192259 RepID=S8ED51_9LAMI|nr:hypothetical protein M569_00882 [Genlisea aurea]
MAVKLLLLAILLLQASAELQRYGLPSKDGATHKFIVVGDWGRKGRYNQSLIASQMGRIGDELDIDFVLSTGDNFYDDGLTGEDDPAIWESFTNIYTATSLQKPWFVGNHDYRGDVLAQLGTIDPRWSCFRSSILQSDVAELFLVDTTPFVEKYFTNPDDHKYDLRDITPLESYTSNLLNDLESALNKSRAKWKIVVGHHTLRSVGHHGDTQDLVHRLLPILRNNDVDFYINGHDHNLQRIKDRESKVEFVTSGGGSKAWRGDIKDVDVAEEEVKFLYDGQGFLSLEITRNDVVFVFYDVDGVPLHKWTAASKSMHGGKWGIKMGTRSFEEFGNSLRGRERRRRRISHKIDSILTFVFSYRCGFCMIPLAFLGQRSSAAAYCPGDCVLNRGIVISKARSRCDRNSISFSSHREKRRRSDCVILLSAKMADESGRDLMMFTSGASVRLNALLSLYAVSSLWRLISAVFFVIRLPFRRRYVAAGASHDSAEKCGAKEDRSFSSRMRIRKVSRKTAVIDKDVAARRALAIERTAEETEEKNDEAKTTKRAYSLFSSTRGDTIFAQSWTPANLPVRGLVIILHGLNEHSGRYNDFAMKLNANGFKVYGMDWIGHGGSDGLHAYVHSLDYAVNDLKTYLANVLAENPSLPCFCFGHSTGGAIILKAVLDLEIRQLVNGVVLTSPAVGVIAPVFSFLAPRYQFRAANKMGVAVSRDPQALLAKYSDPLVFTGSIRARTGYEILRITGFLQKNLHRLTVPFLVLHGTEDAVTSPAASQKLHREASSTDKTIQLCQGLLHDLLFEPEKEAIMENIVKWLVTRL